MNRYDVVVIGLSRAGAAIADAAAAAGRKVAVVRLSETDGEADRLSYALEQVAPPQNVPVRFDVLAGPANFRSEKHLSVGGADVPARRYVIAVGASPRFPDGLDGVPLASPLEIFSANGNRPLSAVILGGGPVAAVLADRLQASGGNVTIAARSPRLLPKEDESVSAALSERFRARGIALNMAVAGLSISPRGGGYHARFCCGGDNLEAQSDQVVAATGVLPTLEGLGLEKARVLTRDGRVVTNDMLNTSNPRIFAAGHAVEPGASLAVQDHQAEIVATNLTAPFWALKRVEPGEAPFALRTTPPVARVGLTEAQARAKYRDIVVGSFQDASVMIKLVGRRRRGRLLGAHVVGPGAVELVLFFDLLIRSEISIPDVPERRHFPLPGPSDAAYRALTAWTSAAD